MFNYNGRCYFLVGMPRMIKVGDVKTNTWITDTLDDRERSAAMAALIASKQAFAYMCGRQDAGNGGHDTDVATAFGKAYGAHVFGYKNGEHHTMENLKSAYGMWRAGELPPNVS